ncbi:MAG: putative Ig domain-containing protein [Acidobacteria bacterium]|nr:putative Ig domain-containing protein [Acidobacteriota bacterium]
MNTHITPTRIVFLNRNWERFRLVLASSFVMLAAVLTWQVSARFSASAKSNSLAANSATSIPAAPAAAMQGGCNNCCGSWSQKSSTGPSARDIHAMAYAQACNRVVLFGGRAAGGFPPANVTDDTWEWNGNTMTWTQFFPATRPGPRGQHAMVYDAARNEIVLFGGFNQNFVGLNDTWVYSCATHTWTQKFPATSPSIRHGHAMAYDPNKQLVVMYGGGSNKQDTWTWDGTNWVEIIGANQPGIRHEHAMAFDGTRIILFGGSKNAGYADNDTWDLTLTSPSAGTWTMIAPNGSGPNKRQRHAMAYDPGCRKVILFGGWSDIATYADDTWEWRRDTLSWCQTSVPTPPSPARQFSAMAYDGKGVIMNGGLNSSLAQIQDTWRFACNRAYTYRAGLMDDFALPTDPTSPTAAFMANVDAFYSTPPKMDFDEPTTNKFLLHSFTGLPTNIVRAELEVRAQPNGGASNDSIHLDFPPFNAPSFTWGKNFFALHPGGTWDPGQGAYTFTLDLCNLPAGGAGQPTNLLGLLNANQSLHIMIQDDTSVDYIKLRVWSCPPRRYHGGLPVESLGQAQLSEDANGNLLIGDIGVSGNDGATFQVGETRGASIKMVDTLSSLPNGSYVEARGIGRVGGTPNSPASSMRIAMTNTGAELTPNFSALGATTFHVILYNDGNTVFSQGGLSGNAVSVPAAAVAPLLQFGGSGNIVGMEDMSGLGIIITEDVLLRVNGQDIGTGDTLVFAPENPTQSFDLLTNFQFGGAGVSTLRAVLGNITCCGFSGSASNTSQFQVGGNAQLEPFVGGVSVTGIGSSGQDGVTINLRKSQSFGITFDPLDPMSIAPVGASLQISTSHILNVLPPPPPRNDNLSLTATKPIIPPIFPETYRVAANFSELGATSLHVTAFNGATQVAEMTNFTGEVLVSKRPLKFSFIDLATLGYQLDFPSGAQVKFGPCPPAPCDQGFTITSLRVQPQTTNVTVSYFTNVSLTAIDLPEFTITGMTMVPFCNSTISVSPGSLPLARVNQAYTQQLTAGGGLGTYRFNITSGSLTPGLSLNRVTGVISGTPTVDGSATFTVTATDDNGCTGSQAYTLNAIICPTITVNPATAANGTVGTSYSQTFTGSGGLAPYSFARVTGTLPPGLTLNANNGLLSGTPTQAGTFNFTVEATDVLGCTGNRGYSVVINPVCPAITVNPATSPNGFVGTAYSQTFTASGGTGPYTFARITGTLPPGLTLSGATGLLSGTPTTAGTYTFTVEATAANGCTGTQPYTVVISGNGLMFYPLAAPVRFLDTRPAQTGCLTPGTPIAGGTSFTLGGAGFCGVPSVARAVMGNITVVTPAANGFLTLFPSGATQPTAANTNFISGEVLNNVFTVGLGAADGAFKIFASTTVHVVVDVTGYFAPPQPAPATGLYFHPLPTPIRLEDTRVGLSACFTPGTPLPGGVDTTHQGTTTCNGVTIPSVARAIIGNITVVAPLANGFITVFPGDTTRPLASSGNYRANTVLNSPFMVGLSSTGQFKVYSVAQTDVVIDVSGYFSPEPVDVNGTGLLFTPIVPSRLQDTRPGQAACFNLGTPLPSGMDVTQPAAGSCTIASTARAIMGNVTVVTPAAQGFITFWPSNIPRPLIATSNFQTSRNFNRFFTVGLGPADGAFKMFSLAMPHLVVDVSGYFAP